MNKPVIRWKPIAQEDPSDRTRTLYVPHITERNDTKTLADVVYSAIDRGLIAGLKTSAAQAIAEGILAQLGEELNSARGVIFGDFFAVRAYLTGTVDGLLGSLTDMNTLATRFVAGSALRLTRDRFSFRNVLETGDQPVIDDVQDTFYGVSGEVAVDTSVQLIGSQLKIGENDKVVVTVVNADETETVVKECAAPDAMQNSDLIVQLSGVEFAVNKKYGFTVVKKVAAGDGTAEVRSNTVYAVCTHATT